MSKVRLDNAGVAELLKSPALGEVITGYGETVRGHLAADAAVTRNNMPVGSISGISDRVRTIVTIKHPGGLGVQAKHGSLTKAVSAAGLSMKGSTDAA